MVDYLIYYSESNIFCTIVFAILLAHDLLNKDRQEKQIKYDLALVSFMLYFAVDCLYAAVQAGFLPAVLPVVAPILFGNYILMAALTYAWLEYVMALGQVPRRNRPLNRFAIAFPFLVSVAVLAVIFVAAPRVLLTQTLEVRPAFNALQIIVPIIYIGATLFYSLRKAFQADSPMERRRHIFIGSFPLMVVAGGLVQIILLPRTPIFCFCCTLLMFIFYIQSMEAQISKDPLTQLNNRGQLRRYMAQLSSSHREYASTYIVMIDINDFKHINDTYGHAEGDTALVLVADALKDVASGCKMPLFMSRYGGDEFVLIVHPDSGQALEPLISQLRERIGFRCRQQEKPYELTVGVGFDELLHDHDTVQKCIQRADKKMYTDKLRVKEMLRAGA